MAYIGNIPAESYASFETETFSVSATANYTLSHAVTNENEIRLVINGVVQQPGSGKAYTASGTTLTLTSATVSGDSMYAVYLGRALQTVNPPNASVGTSQLGSDAVTGAKIADDAISDEHLDPTVITGQTAETSIATDDLILLSDTSASGALRKMTRANFVSGVGGDNTPAFHVYNSGDQDVSVNTETTVVFNTEVVDTDNAFASNAFTVPSGEGGKYYIYFQITYATGTDMTFQHTLKINNSYNADSGFRVNGYNHYYASRHYSRIIDLSAGDVLKIITQQNGGTMPVSRSENRPVFGGYKLIGV